MADVAIGLDLGGTKLLGVALDGGGRAVLPPVRAATGRDTDAAQIVAAAAAICLQLRAIGHRVVGVGVGFPGAVDVSRGIARSTVMLDGWREVPLSTMVQAAVAAPCAVDNDVRAAALAEVAELSRVGDPAAHGTVVLCAVGTGIGGAVVVDGVPLRGAHGIAGELGHIVVDPRGPLCRCGRRGCVGALASGPAIERAAGLAPGDLASAFVEGTPAVRTAVRRAARWLGVALADVVHLVDPDLVVLGGGVSALGPAYVQGVAGALQSNVFAEARGVRVQAALAGYEAAARGAALLGWQAAGQRPKGEPCS